MSSLTTKELKSRDNAQWAPLRGPSCFNEYRDKRAAISFTGGKDCHLALQRAMDAGVLVVCGCSFMPPGGGSSFQAHRLEWQQQQGQAMGIPIVECPLTLLETMPDNKKDYKAAYAGAIRRLQQDQQIDIIITGDIDFVGSSTTNFMQQVCAEQDTNNVQVVLPLWQQDRRALLTEMVQKHNFDIRLCCVKSPHFDETWTGRGLDPEAISILEQKEQDGLDLTGENGEYHTMVVNGPMYKTKHLKFVDVEPKELVQQRGQDEARWWVIKESARLVPIAYSS